MEKTHLLSAAEENLLDKAENLIKELYRRGGNESTENYFSTRELVEELDKTFDELTGGFYSRFLTLPSQLLRAAEPKEDPEASRRWTLAERYLMDWQMVYKALDDAREGNLYEFSHQSFTPRIQTVAERTYQAFVDLRDKLEEGLPSIADQIRKAQRSWW